MSANPEEENVRLEVLILRTPREEGRPPREEEHPFLSELRRIDPRLEYEEDEFTGGGPIAPDFVLAAVTIFVASQYLKGFLSAAGAAHHQALHECMARLINKRALEEEKALEGEDLSEVEVEGELPMTAPLSVSAGRVNFYFQGQLTPEQVTERLRKAQELADSLPEEDFRLNADELRRPRNFIWDEDAKSWVEKGPRYDPNFPDFLY